MNNVMQAIPFLPNTCVILESTARGVGNYFHRLVKGAESNSNGWTLFFAPWYDHAEYSLPIPDEYDMTLMADGRYGDEISEQKEYNLTIEQMYWRRVCITMNCNGKLKMFRQDYPANIDEAFISSGYPVFDLMKLNKIRDKSVELPIKTAIFEMGEFKEMEDGYIEFWNMPYDGKTEKWTDRYVIFADTGGVWEGADYSCAKVYDRVLKKIVCQVHAHLEPYRYADLLCYLGYFYHNALVAVEMNKWASETDENGQTVIDYMSNQKNYPNLYTHQVFDNVVHQNITKYGYHMNANTKQKVVDKGYKFINEWQSDHIIEPDVKTYDEMNTFVVQETPGGKTTWGAAITRDEDGYTLKDDRVITFLGCLDVSSGMPEPKQVELGDFDVSEEDRRRIF
jgi:hypothetical protein